MKVVHSIFLVVIFLDKIDLLKVVNCQLSIFYCPLPTAFHTTRRNDLKGFALAAIIFPFSDWDL